MKQISNNNYTKQAKQQTLIYIIIGLIVVGLLYYFYIIKKPSAPDLSTTPTVSNVNLPPTQREANQVSDTKVVTIENFQFSPQSITIKKGDSVVWKNNDSVTHTITSDVGNELSIEPLNAGISYVHSFNNVGTFNYHCNIHKSMQGTVIVTE